MGIEEKGLSMLVHQILKSKSREGVLTLSPTAPVTDAIKIMSDEKLGTIVVSADGEAPTGILSERDLVREMGKRGTACLNDTVGDMMTKNPVTCVGSDSADQVLEMMTEGRFRHLPVLEDGKMIGLISIGDVVKARLAELSMEKDALQGMIMGH